MYWRVDDYRDFYDIDELCDYLFDPDNYDDDDAVDDYIDDCYYDQKVTINGIEFTASEIVRGCSDDLFYDLKQEWRESMAESDRDNYFNDLENMDNEDVEYYNGYKVECFTDDEDDEEDCEEEEPEQEEIALPDYAEQINIRDFLTDFQKLF